MCQMSVGGVCLCECWGNCLKYLKKAVQIRKRGEETKILEWGSSWVKGWVP